MKRKINVATLDDSHRRALEEIIGCELEAHQRLVISVIEEAGPPAIPADAQPVRVAYAGFVLNSQIGRKTRRWVR